MLIEVYVPAVPVAQPRAKATTINGAARMYTPTKMASGKTHPIAAFKAAVKLAYWQTCSLKPYEGPVICDCVFVMPRPQILMRKKDPAGRIPHCKKPDRDNLDKSVLDALTGIAWRDDCQVHQGLIEKWYAAKDEQPHVGLRIRRM
jgi:Holliday junction resolvase RusA-like endonuclease